MFYWQYEDGTRPELPTDPARIEQRSACKLLGGSTYELYAKPAGNDEFYWYGYSTSTVTNLNDVAKSQLQPLGAHTLPIEIKMVMERTDYLRLGR